MRLSAELISLAEQRPNPLGEREVVLRGMAIPMIEHLGATRDAYDCIDLSDNRLTNITNFPRLARLTSLTVTNNAIEHVDGINLGKNLPNLETLILTNNCISGLHELANIGKGCPKLQFLSLRGNPVVRRQHYRLYAISKIPTLKVLDFQKVKQSERDRAGRLASSAAGAALEGDVRIEARAAAAEASSAGGVESGGDGGGKTFEPGEGRTAEEAFATSFTPEQKAAIRDMVANASSPAEIERIEGMVKRGIFPAAPPPPPPPPPSSTSDRGGLGKDVAQEVGTRKRGIDEEDADSDTGTNSKKTPRQAR